MRRMPSQSKALLVGLGLLVGCASGPRRPLFSIADLVTPDPRPHGATRPAPPVAADAGTRPLLASPDAAPVASPSASRDEIDSLVAKLREARGAERVRVLERLVKLGALSPADLD